MRPQNPVCLASLVHVCSGNQHSHFDFPEQNSSFYIRSFLCPTSNPVVTEFVFGPRYSQTLFLVLATVGFHWIRSQVVFAVSVYTHIIHLYSVTLRQDISETIRKLNVSELNNKLTCYKGLKNRNAYVSFLLVWDSSDCKIEGIYETISDDP